jgi:two-component system, OmpR family, phosphate regulon response regulator PhoB
MKQTPRVLIVEDEPAIAELISVNLRHNGFTPVWAEDGVSAQRELDAVLPDAGSKWHCPGAQMAQRPAHQGGPHPHAHRAW